MYSDYYKKKKSIKEFEISYLHLGKEKFTKKCKAISKEVAKMWFEVNFNKENIILEIEEVK